MIPCVTNLTSFNFRVAFEKALRKYYVGEYEIQEEETKIKRYNGSINDIYSELCCRESLVKGTFHAKNASINLGILSTPGHGRPAMEEVLLAPLLSNQPSFHSGFHVNIAECWVDASWWCMMVVMHDGEGYHGGTSQLFQTSIEDKMGAIEGACEAAIKSMQDKLYKSHADVFLHRCIEDTGNLEYKKALWKKNRDIYIRDVEKGYLPRLSVLVKNVKSRNKREDEESEYVMDDNVIGIANILKNELVRAYIYKYQRGSVMGYFASFAKVLKGLTEEVCEEIADLIKEEYDCIKCRVKMVDEEGDEYETIEYVMPVVLAENSVYDILGVYLDGLGLVSMSKSTKELWDVYNKIEDGVTFYYELEDELELDDMGLVKDTGSLAEFCARVYEDNRVRMDQCVELFMHECSDEYYPCKIGMNIMEEIIRINKKSGVYYEENTYPIWCGRFAVTTDADMIKICRC